MRFVLLLIITVLLYKPVQSQKQASIWYFGENAGLNFNSYPRLALTDGALNMFEGTASIADENGNLLFYTDGVTVYNRQHQVMPNGHNLWGSYTTTQTLIVPKPGDDPIYYIFTASPQFDYIFGPGTDSVGFHYSVVEMNLEGGLGDVTQKNILLFKNTTEKITAVHHVNGNDIWVITHEWNNSSFRSYLITEIGIDPIPVISSKGRVHSGGGENNSNAGAYMKISPDGSKVGVVIPATEIIEVFNFNKSTGQIDNSIGEIVNVNKAGLGFYGLEFSPNSKLLYFTLSISQCGVNLQSEVWQYSFEKSRSVKVGNYVGALNSMQLAIDGKIYIARCNEIIRDSGFMAAINNPNREGTACNFDSRSALLNGKKNTIGLSNFIQSYFLFEDPTLDMPNVFTPNSDEYNPVFKPIAFENMLEANIKIINRWGKEIFFTTDVQAGWNGGDNASGIYYWVIQYEGKNGKIGTAKGYVHLIR